MKDPDIQTRLQTLSAETLVQENIQYLGTGGVSANNRECGFIPAFLDTDSGTVYRSRFADGKPAPIHVLAGLPKNLIETLGKSATCLSIKGTVIPGFMHAEAFYTREEARQATASTGRH